MALALAGVRRGLLRSDREIAHAAGLSPSYVGAATRLTATELFEVEHGLRPLIVAKPQPRNPLARLAAVVAEVGGVDRALDLMIELAARSAPPPCASKPEAPFVDIPVVSSEELLSQLSQHA